MRFGGFERPRFGRGGECTRIDAWWCLLRLRCGLAGLRCGLSIAGGDTVLRLAELVRGDLVRPRALRRRIGGCRLRRVRGWRQLRAREGGRQDEEERGP